jgi:hypothetical protein
MRTTVAALLITCLLMACMSHRVGDWPAQGTIAAPAGGAAGYQHGVTRSGFIQNASSSTEQHGYVKSTSKEGTLAANRQDGSTFAIPSAHAENLRLPPYGNSVEEHDAFVKNYFLERGLPADQIGGVRGMTMLEATGAVGTTPVVPRIIAYYTVIQRAVDGIQVPDSFAWARVNSRGEVVSEGAYWPALPRQALDEARQLRALLDDPAQREAYASKLPTSARTGALAIRHSAATLGGTFQALATFDVAVPTAFVRTQTASGASREILVRHFDANGIEQTLPQEKLDLGQRFPPGQKQAAGGPSEQR